MIFNRRPGTKFIIGFDLRDDFCQMSYALWEEGVPLQEPQTWSAAAGEEQFNIPAVLCKELGANRWLYGAAAAARAGDPDFTYVPHLLSQALAGEGIRIEEETYDAQALLALFIGRCLAETTALMPEGAERIILFTARTMDSRTVDLLEKVRLRLNLTGEVRCQSYGGSYYHFLLCQEKDLREPGSAAFEYEEGERLRVCRLLCSTGQRPAVIVQEEAEYPGLTADSDAGRDEEFASLAQKELTGRSCGSVYLLGDGFRGGWLKKSVSVLCAGGRRVFLGNNLYSKGAVYAAALKAAQAPVLTEYFFLDTNKLRTNVLIRAQAGGEEKTITLLEAGANWYEVHETAELILDGTGELNLILKPLTGGEALPYHIRLEGLPVREGRITRVRLTFSMNSPQKLRLFAEDLGFGETFPSSGFRWEQIISV